ncbi:MAG TPA: DUF2892 domain-containing protein [Caldilineae bacterium]|nr:DUF2892 domain-containing protein [Caldilineae bacterium]
MFTPNESSWDRIIRIVLGLILLYVGFGPPLSGALGIIVGIIGIILVVTGAIGWCPLYQLLNFKTKQE